MGKYLLFPTQIVSSCDNLGIPDSGVYHLHGNWCSRKCHIIMFFFPMQVVPSCDNPWIPNLDYARHGETDGCYQDVYHLHGNWYSGKSRQLHICAIPGGGKIIFWLSLELRFYNYV